MTPILQMGTWSSKEKELAQGCLAGEWQSWEEPQVLHDISFMLGLTVPPLPPQRLLLAPSHSSAVNKRNRLAFSLIK